MVTFANRLLIGAQQKLAASKRAYQHEQSRARQMKIRQQNVDGSKSIWRVNENVCRTFLSDELSIFAPGGFQNAYDGCTHGRDSFGVIDPASGGSQDGKPLGMHAMLGDVL
jgi:hypothetical protein